METKTNNFKNTKNLAQISMFAVIIALCSWLAIPSAVPFTMQTFAIFCSLGILGGKKGLMSIIIYIMLGLFGVPVFSGFKAGPTALFGATGGYIIGFIFFALVFWLITKVFGSKPFAVTFGMLAGLIVCYAFGTAWFIIIYTKTNAAVTLMTALSWCVIPFIVPDLLKLAAALFVIKKISNYFK